MDSEAHSLQRLKLRAFDLSDRTIRRGEASAVRRIERWRQRAFMIIQCSVTAGVAWLLASLCLVIKFLTLQRLRPSSSLVSHTGSGSGAVWM